MQYYLWSARSGGWLTSGATVTSDRQSAALFSEVEMARRVSKGHNSGWGEFAVLPIPATVLEEIANAQR